MYGQRVRSRRQSESGGVVRSCGRLDHPSYQLPSVHTAGQPTELLPRLRLAQGPVRLAAGRVEPVCSHIAAHRPHGRLPAGRRGHPDAGGELCAQGGRLCCGPRHLWVLGAQTPAGTGLFNSLPSRLCGDRVHPVDHVLQDLRAGPAEPRALRRDAAAVRRASLPQSDGVPDVCAEGLRGQRDCVQSESWRMERVQAAFFTVTSDLLCRPLAHRPPSPPAESQREERETRPGDARAHQEQKEPQQAESTRGWPLEYGNRLPVSTSGVCASKQKHGVTQVSGFSH